MTLFGDKRLTQFISHFFLSLSTPHIMRSYFPSVVSFANHKDSIQKPPGELGDYGQQLASAVDVQEIDTNLYMSRELWLPIGARGAFGGQVLPFYFFSLTKHFFVRLSLKLFVRLSTLLARHSTSM